MTCRQAPLTGVARKVECAGARVCGLEDEHVGLFRETLRGLKPVIYVTWIVAIARLVAEARTTDLNVVAMFSVYMTIAILFLFAGFTGVLDGLVWKRLLLGSVVLGVACWSLPNFVAYSVAQFQGWNHGRFYSDPRHAEVQQRLQEEEGLSYFDARDRSGEVLGYPDPSRGPLPVPTAAGKLSAAATIAAFTGIAGTLWSLVLGIVLVGIPAALRRRG